MKFENVLKGTALVGLLAAPLAISSSLNQVEAQEVVSDHQTNLDIEFTAPTDSVVEVIDPDSGEVLSPGDDTGSTEETGVSQEAGPLTLDYVPYLDFGSHEITGATFEQSLAEANPGARAPFVQVSDRRGTGAGWNVQVSLSEFDSEALAGATLTFGEANAVVGVGGTQATNTGDNVPSATGFSVTTGQDADLVFNAAAGQGRGSWQARWSNDDVSLSIPGNAIDAGQHTATLNWTLTDAPQ